MPQAGRPLEGSAPAPEPGGSTSRNLSARSWTHRPKMQNALQQSTRPFRLESVHRGPERSTPISARPVLARCPNVASTKAADAAVAPPAVALPVSDKGSHATTGVNAHQRAFERRARPERVALIATSSSNRGRREQTRPETEEQPRMLLGRVTRPPSLSERLADSGHRVFSRSGPRGVFGHPVRSRWTGY